MAKKWAKQFYNSQRWLRCRASYITERINIDGGMCENCGNVPGYIVDHIEELTPNNINNPMISLNHENFQYLCLSCHNRKTFKERKDFSDNIFFNEYGQPEKRGVIIVWGSPASGKTTFVKNNMENGDVVVDLDNIMDAISFRGKEEKSDGIISLGLEIREFIYQKIEDREIKANKTWVIAGLPTKRERDELKSRLRGELIHMDADEKTCIKRAMSDSGRPDKALQEKIIKLYWKKYEK